MLAHECAHGFLSADLSIGPLHIPAVGLAVEGGVAEPLVQGTRPRIVLIDAELGATESAHANAFFGSHDQHGADAAALQGRLNSQLPQLAGPRSLDVVDSTHGDREI